jgi:hypothetical protein
LEKQQKPDPKQYGYSQEKIHGGLNKYCGYNIVDKIKTREATYIWRSFIDFSDAFDRMSWSKLFSLL